MKNLNKFVFFKKNRKESVPANIEYVKSIQSKIKSIISKKTINQKQILITGGLGFVGYHLVKKLVAKNYFPIIIDNLSNSSVSSLSGIFKEKYFFAKIDIRNLVEIKKAVSDFNPKIIIHLAALHFIPYCNKHPKEVLKVNLKGTENILKIAKQFKVNNFLFASTAAVYAPSNRRHTENSTLEPMDIYGQSKKLAEEKIINCVAENQTLKFVILRLFNVYGYGDNTPHFIPAMIKKIKSNSKIFVGNLETIRDYIYVDDVIDAIFKIIKKDENFNNQIYNLGTGNGINGADAIKLITHCFKKNLSTKQDKTLLRKIDQPKLVADIRKFSKKYNWSPKYNIKKGLKKLCEK
ncbi:MAG: NAD(P)-dependent oxidoreductase [Patescibacteria group bacterium]